ncbi:acetyltransferase [Psychroflexus tropicus]|uniref:acetyltransferase n=1 Tax=Psychroflexus tropicus TaxID=197345 RepID=UPI0003756164|nr:acetyltransferase [Psychroflexus tropicus]
MNNKESRKINLYGASGHAKVILDIIASTGDVEVAYFFDDDESITSLLGHEVLSPSDHQDQLNQYPLIISVGSNSVRKQLVNRLESNLFSKALIHSSAQVSEAIAIKEGSVVMPLAVINTSSIVGKHCIINSGAVVEHDCELGDFVHISPNATICGGVQIGKGTHIGAGAILIPNISIGENCVVGAGTVVINDLPNHTKAVGNPARPIQ